jgi:predicted transcriptional regulator
MAKRNVTVSLDEETARWARVEAARRDTSVSSLLGDLLREEMERERSYEAAMRRWLAGPVRPLKRGGRYPSREELHERGDGT